MMSEPKDASNGDGGGDSGSGSGSGSGRGSFSGRDRKALHGAVKSAVDATNSALASLEATTGAASSSVLSHLRALGRQASLVGARAASAYEGRGRYGPQIVAGSAATLGGLVALRRGRVPGALAGAAAGAASYVGVYGLPVYKASKD